MIHAKILIVDGVWTVAGTTNMDSRSFALNDEISAALLDPRAGARFEEDFTRDLSRSRRITLEAWRNRPFLERAEERIGALYQRQQ
jgi:cardiolipin synthase